MAHPMSREAEAASRLLEASARRLLRHRALDSIRTAAWITSATALAAVAVHLLYHTLEPAVLALLLGAIGTSAMLHAAARRPSRQDAAAFVDQSLEGQCAYGTLLELQREAPAPQRADPTGDGSTSVARAAFLEWIEAHALRAEQALRAMPPTAWPPTAWPHAALMSAALATVLAFALLQLPGRVATGASVPSLPDQSLFSDVSNPHDPARARSSADAAQTERAGDARRQASRERAPPQSEAPRASAAASPERAGSSESAGASSLPAPRSASVSAQADVGGFAAGTARDELAAAELARVLDLAAIDRRPLTGIAVSRASDAGAALGVDPTASAAAGRPLSGMGRAAALPSDLASWSASPAQQVLIQRYFARRKQRP